MDDIAYSTVFLFSEGASYITGVVLVVDGKLINVDEYFLTLRILKVETGCFLQLQIIPMLFSILAVTSFNFEVYLNKE